jgi:histidinol-phosphate aminotransferase
MATEPIYLDRNENNYGPAPKCLEVLKNVTPGVLSSYTKAYTRGVKSSLSERLASDFKVEEKQVLLGYGAEDILKQVVQCYLGAGEKLMIPSYSWWYYKEIANEVNGVNLEYPLHIGEDSYQYHLSSMLELIDREKPGLVFVSSPNNPTGNSISNDDLYQLMQSLKDTIVVLDEAYWYHRESQQTIRLISEFPNLVVIRTFSKYYALAGLRIGYALVGRGLDRLIKLSNRYLGYNSITEEIALAALDSPGYYEDIALKMESDKNLYQSELGKIPGFTVYSSDANFILIKIPQEIMKPLKAFLTEKGLIVKFMNEPEINSHLRITIGTQEQNRLVIEAIKEYCGVT